MESDARTLGGRLKDLRDQKRMSQAEVASYLGILQETYSKWERDVIQLHKKATLEKLAVLFDTTVEHLTRTNDGLGHLPAEVQQFLRDQGPEATGIIIEAYAEYKKIMLQKAMGRA